MRKLITIFIFLFFRLFSFSQDLACDKIILKTGEELEVIVLEITIAEIKYKKCSMLDGPIFIIERKSVFLIKYKNGTKDVINDLDQTENKNNYTIVSKERPIKEKRVKKTPFYFGFDLIADPRHLSSNFNHSNSYTIAFLSRYKYSKLFEFDYNIGFGNQSYNISNFYSSASTKYLFKYKNGAKDVFYAGYQNFCFNTGFGMRYNFLNILKNDKPKNFNINPFIKPEVNFILQNDLSRKNNLIVALNLFFGINIKNSTTFSFGYKYFGKKAYEIQNSNLPTGNTKIINFHNLVFRMSFEF